MHKLIEWFSHHGKIINRITLFIISVALIVFLFPRQGKFKYDFQQGRPWLHDDLIAPYDFPVYKTDAEIQSEKNILLEDFSPVFYRDKAASDSAAQKFGSLFYSEMKSLFPQSDSSTAAYWYSFLSATLDTIFSTGIIESVPVIEGDNVSGFILLRQGNEAEKVELQRFYTIKKARDSIYQSLDLPDSCVVFRTLLADVLVRNIRFDKAATEQMLLAEVKKISPTRGMVQRGERIISRGDLVTEKRFQILNSLKLEDAEQSGASSDRRLVLAGQILLAIISMLTFVLFLVFFRNDVFSGKRDFLLVLSVLLLMIVITSAVVNLFPEYIFLVPVCLVPIIIRVFYDHSLALFSLFIVLIITGFLVPNSFEFIFLQLITGIVTIIANVNLQRRSQFFYTSLIVIITYSVIYLALQLIQDTGLSDLDPMIFLQFLINGILLLLAFPVIFLFEKMFRKVTDVTLMELSDTNNRLLRMLANEAPGTFQHSIMVANLAEEAVRTIGGNPLLVRTGALYHDIGKIDNPQYFIENQAGAANMHDGLSNVESAQIIKNHVLNGIDRARRYKLPEQIIDFIRTHHGTSKIGYFYAMAKLENDNEAPDERIYTYPGPEPFSKETCILMMADSIEAASRSLKVPSEANINDLVEKIVAKQIELKQFENASITFRDISIAKDIFKNRLKNMYHVRIEYPE